MLTASDYRKRSRKVITIPSGGEVEIRKLSVSDFLSAGEVPLAFMEAIESGKRESVESAVKSNPELTKRINDSILINGVVSLKLVGKSPRECAEDEVSVSEIDPIDQNFIIDAISELNNLGSGGGKSIGRFPEESIPPGGDRPDGEAVRETSD